MIGLLLAVSLALPPVVQKRCLGCHNEQLKDGRLSFEDRESVRESKSRILGAIRHDGDVRMPPGKKLSAREMKQLTAWLKKL